MEGADGVVRGKVLLLGFLMVALVARPGVAAEPPEPAYAARSLVLDIERIVDDEESAGWFVDDDAIVSMKRSLLESVCRTPPVARDLALAELKRASAREGSARSLYEAEGRKVTALVERARVAERRLLALRTANGWAREQCPIWVEADAAFRGRQTDRDRFALHLESGGNAQIRITEGTATIGAGGVGRLLLGHGFGGDLSLLVGLEFGGGAMLRPGADSTEFVVNYFPAIPVVLRLHDIAWHYDFELGPVALFQADNERLSYGFRVGGAVGLSGLKTRGVVPWAGAVLMFEHYFPNGRRAATEFLRGGVRVGVSWDG